MSQAIVSKRSLFDWQTLVGILALGCLLALSLPGIRIARADQSAQSAEALQCSPAAPTAQATTSLARLRSKIQKREMAQADPEIVVLNSRGYNHAEPPQVPADLETLRREAAQPSR